MKRQQQPTEKDKIRIDIPLDTNVSVLDLVALALDFFPFVVGLDPFVFALDPFEVPFFLDLAVALDPFKAVNMEEY